MGTRLNVVADGINYYGTKHYGYSRNYSADDLPSAKYLRDVVPDQIPEDASFDLPECIPAMRLSKEQFVTFIHLYNSEYVTGQSWPYPHDILTEPKMQQLLNCNANVFEICWE